MDLKECKTCAHHVSVLKNSILCGYNIDRVELPIHKNDDDSLVISGCPKQKSN